MKTLLPLKGIFFFFFSDNHFYLEKSFYRKVKEKTRVLCQKLQAHNCYQISLSKAKRNISYPVQYEPCTSSMPSELNLLFLKDMPTHQTISRNSPLEAPLSQECQVDNLNCLAHLPFLFHLPLHTCYWFNFPE